MIRPHLVHEVSPEEWYIAAFTDSHVYQKTEASIVSWPNFKRTEGFGRLDQIMKLTNAILASLVALIVLSAPLAHAADTTASATTGQPLHFLWLKDGTGKIGGFVLTGLDSSDNLKVFIVVWGLSPNTLYTVWIADCTAQGPPGDYPCPQGGALNSGPGVFGTNSPSCPVAGEGGPLTFIQTNFFGFGSSNLISIPLKGVAYPGLHYAHFDMGIGCVPAPAYPPGFYATQGFSFTI